MKRISAATRNVRKRLQEDSLGPPFALLCIMYAGSTTFYAASRSPSLEALAPGWLMVVWTVALGFGGLGFLAGKFLGRFRMELSGCLLIAYGLSMYLAALIIAAGWASWMLALTYGAFVSGFLIRARVLHLALKAQREASKKAGERAPDDD